MTEFLTEISSRPISNLLFLKLECLQEITINKFNYFFQAHIKKLQVHQMTEQIKFNHQIIKSLLLIVSIMMISYITFSISLQIVPLLISDSASQYFIIHLSGQILAIASIVDAPVLYFCR